MNDPPSAPSIATAQATKPPLQLVRLPVDKPQPAVAFLHTRSQGVMDLIAHFWERLAHTPPLQRSDLHLVVATATESYDKQTNISDCDSSDFTGAMLYVPKAHRADVLALDAPTASAFAAYIEHHGPKSLQSDATPLAEPALSASAAPTPANSTAPAQLPITNPQIPVPTASPAPQNGRIPIDFLTGEAQSIAWIVPLLLPLVHKRTPARQFVNVVMQLPDRATVTPCPNVRLAKESDVPTLNRWRRLYKEERGILFDADMDAWIQQQRIFVLEIDSQIVALAKLDLELQTLVEIGGVYTFPEFRTKGYGGSIVSDLAARIRQLGKTPTLQVDDQNTPALQLYQKAGWRPMGKLARVWLTG